jgi:hypothetical protein
LAIAEVLHVARVAQRASLEEVAGNILEWTEQNHPEALERTTTEIDEFFAQLPQPTATPPMSPGRATRGAPPVLG